MWPIAVSVRAINFEQADLTARANCGSRKRYLSEYTHFRLAAIDRNSPTDMLDFGEFDWTKKPTPFFAMVWACVGVCKFQISYEP